MSHDPLATYLNDHLAGSVVAIRLLTSLEASYAARTETRALTQRIGEVRLEIEAERAVLEALIARVGTAESSLRKTAGWFAERFAQAKMAVDDQGDGAFREWEEAEVVTLGIMGKRGLWRVLQSVPALQPLVGDVDVAALVQRSDSQFERMEVVRLDAAARCVARASHGTS